MSNYLKKLDGAFLNSWVAYRILFTIPVIVVSAERSFSKLELIKTYIWSTMSQERLNDWAILSINKDMIEKLDYANLFNIFSSKNASRAYLNWYFVATILLTVFWE